MTPSTFKSPEVGTDSETLTEQDGIEAATLVLSVAGKLGLAQQFKDSSLTATEQRALLHALAETVADDLKESAESLVLEIAPVKGGTNERLRSLRQNFSRSDAVGEPAGGRIPEEGSEEKGVRSAVSGFFGKAKKVIRTAALAAALIFTGPTMSSMPADIQNAVITQVARQDAYLADFEQEVRSGEQKLGGIANRSGMYGQATWAIGLQVVATMARTGKMVKERNVLGGNEHHCSECPALTDLGWVEIGTLPPVGERECMVMDRCHLEYMDAAGKIYEVFV